jgi:hypothetical protein
MLLLGRSTMKTTSSPVGKTCESAGFWPGQAA